MVLIELTWEKEKIDWTLEPHAFEPSPLGVVFLRCTLHKNKVCHHKFFADLVAFTEEILHGKLHFFVQYLSTAKQKSKKVKQSKVQ